MAWNLNKRRSSKYGAIRTPGHASKKEERRSLQLQTLLRSGLISDLKEQVSYTLIPPQRDADGKAVRACRYIADFVYTDQHGNTIVEDTKGYRTPEYRIKKKLMLYIHGINIKET